MVPGYLDSVYTSLYSIMCQYLYCLHSTHFSTPSISLTSVSSSEAFHQFMTCLMSKSHVTNCPQFCFVFVCFLKKNSSTESAFHFVFSQSVKRSMIEIAIFSLLHLPLFPLFHRLHYFEPFQMLLPKQNDVKLCFVLAKLKFQDDICF